MKIVKLTFNHDWPLFRQVPGNKNIWGNFQFVIDDELKECDAWVVYSDYKLERSEVICNPNNVLFIPAEGPNTSPEFSRKFLDQFARVVTVQKKIKHKNKFFYHNANPWFVEKSHDELLNLTIPKKEKLICVLTSNKNFSKGHRKRLDFISQLKNHFGDQLDVFGKGINDFDSKFDLLSKYKYSIVIENDFLNYWVTEKLFDCLLTYTIPIYYGCPNLKEIIKEDCYIPIDINYLNESIKLIEDSINNNYFEKKIHEVESARKNYLMNESFFPFLVGQLNKLDFSLDKKLVIIEKDRLNNWLKFKRSYYYLKHIIYTYLKKIY